jgi:hypothetical protein
MFLVSEIISRDDEEYYEKPLCLFDTEKEAKEFSKRCGCETGIFEVPHKNPELLHFTFVFDIYEAYLYSKRECFKQDEDITLEVSMPKLESCSVSVEPNTTEDRSVGLAYFTTVTAPNYNQGLKMAESKVREGIYFNRIGANHKVNKVYLKIKC